MGMKSFFVVMLVVVAGSLPAAAENKIVLESYTGGKTEAAARQLAPLLEALARKEFHGGYDVLGRSFESRVSRPAITDGLPANFTALVDAAQQAFFAGKFEEAANTLGPLIDRAHANAGEFARDQSALGSLEKALTVLALSHQRMGDPGAMQQTFAELIRTFPEKVVSRGLYGAEAATAFDQAKKTLAAAGRGKLIVRSSVDTGVIFINERIQQAGTVTREELAAGDYRVFVQLPGKQLSRQHRVTVRAKETAVLDIDAEFDLVVQTSPNWTGLAFASAADRERSEIERASQFASAIDASAVAVVGIDQVRGRPAIIGILVNRNRSAEIRRASVALEPTPSAERLQALALFLAGEAPAPEGIDVDVVTPPSGGPGEPVRRDGGSHAWGGWKWVTGGLAVVALGAGGYLLATDGDCKTQPPAGVTCPDVYNNAVPGYLAVGGGAVLAGLSVYLFVRGGGSSSRTAYVVPTAGGAYAALSLRF